MSGLDPQNDTIDQRQEQYRKKCGFSIGRGVFRLRIRLVPGAGLLWAYDSHGVGNNFYLAPWRLCRIISGLSVAKNDYFKVEPRFPWPGLRYGGRNGLLLVSLADAVWLLGPAEQRRAC